MRNKKFLEVGKGRDKQPSQSQSSWIVALKAHCPSREEQTAADQTAE